MNVGHVRALVERRAFRQLLAARLTGQFADGLLQAGLVGVVLFAPERAASPTRIAVGFAVLLLPFTLLAPLAGVLLDRWSRVAVLRWANVSRAILISITAIATATAASEVLIFGPALLALALNRLILAALGASLPRTVPPELLVTGNAVAPTVGTFVTVIGGGVGLALPRRARHVGRRRAFHRSLGRLPARSFDDDGFQQDAARTCATVIRAVARPPSLGRRSHRCCPYQSHRARAPRTASDDRPARSSSVP